jgi:hypothetical protein
LQSDKTPSLELTISFSGVPVSATAPHEAESPAAPSSLPPTEIVPDDRIESTIDHAAHNADALCNPAGVETGIVIIDTIVGSVGPIQSALAYAESLNGTLDCLAESARYLNGVIGLVKDFADVRVFLLCSFALVFSSRVRSTRFQRSP